MPSLHRGKTACRRKVDAQPHRHDGAVGHRVVSKLKAHGATLTDAGQVGDVADDWIWCWDRRRHSTGGVFAALFHRSHRKKLKHRHRIGGMYSREKVNHGETTAVSSITRDAFSLFILV